MDVLLLTALSIAALTSITRPTEKQSGGSSPQVQKVAFALLTRYPADEWLQFLEEIADETNIHIFVFTDTPFAGSTRKVKVIHYDDKECSNNGYKGAVSCVIPKLVISWDKAIYHFCKADDTYDFVWFVEDDVFIPSVKSVKLLTEKCAGICDLAIASNIQNDTGELTSWCWWKMAVGAFELPWYHSMACAMGASKKLLQTSKEYIETHRNIPYHEFFFNTLAMQNGLVVCNPEELSTILWTPEGDVDISQHDESKWYHSVKDISSHLLNRKNQTAGGSTLDPPEIVVSRYEEDISWVEPLTSEHKITCYNKGKTYVEGSIALPNVGRCDHTFLHHIITNYDNLSEITIFLPGSCMDSHKEWSAKFVINKVRENRNSVFYGRKHDDVKSEYMNFSINEWKATNENNASLNPETTLHLSDTRPFGAWFEKHFPGASPTTVVCYFSIFAVSKKHILQHPVERYKKILQELEVHSNPEVGHYVERSWGAIFQPYNKEECEFYY